MSGVWTLRGTVFVAWNCDWGCPCNFNALPSKGKCEGGWTWHVETGRYGDVPLDGLNFSVYANWPGAIHHGNGEGLILIDERADARQREAIGTLIGGHVGGPWGVLGWTWPKVHGPFAVPYDVHLDGINSRITCGSYVEIEGGPIKNPVTGAEVHPGIVLPEGLVLKRGDLGASKRFVVKGGIGFRSLGPIRRWAVRVADRRRLRRRAFTSSGAAWTRAPDQWHRSVDCPTTAANLLDRFVEGDRLAGIR